jgi:tetratricopeptide (TPR) repeat protein
MVASGAPRSLSLSADLEPVEDSVARERLVNLLEMAFFHNDAGNTDPAILACEAALAINPASSTAHSLLGTLYEKKGDSERAIEHFEAVVNLNPDSTADVAKLEQLRSGLRTKAFAPPRGYRWVPPALASVVANSALRSKAAPLNLDDRRIGSVKLFPALVSLAAVIAVATTGMVLLHNGGQAHPGRTASIRVGSVASSPFADPGSLRAAPQTQNSGATWPSYTPPPPTPITNLSKGRDPFAETLKPGTSTRPAWTDAPSAPGLPTPHSGRRDSSTPTLPPLKLVAQPPGGSSSLAPAPVSVVNPPAVSIDSIPHQIVPVTRLGGDMASTQGGSNAGTQDTNDNGNSVIHVAVHSGGDNASSGSSNGLRVTESDSGSSSAPSPTVSVDRASAWQQSALSAQQDGNYRSAVSSYQQAIHAYKMQIAEGRNVDAAQRGLKACQTGLEICQQSAQ